MDPPNAEAAAASVPPVAKAVVTPTAPATEVDIGSDQSAVASSVGVPDEATTETATEAGPPSLDASASTPSEIEIPQGLTPTAAAVFRARALRAALPPGPQPIEILGTRAEPGSRVDARWQVGESFDGSVVQTPVVLVHGLEPGPRLCLTAGVHGDELNGVEVVRRVVNDTDPKILKGTLIAVPIVNLMGFARGSRYLPDRRDLNRFFPGFAQGSAASRMAFSLFREVIVHCDGLVDLHTGSFDRSNLPQVRGDLRNDSVVSFTRGFGATPVLHSPGARGMLRLAATDHDIPAVTFEVGAPYRLEPDKIDAGVQAVKTLMHQMGMTPHFRLWSEPQATFYESKWVRVNDGGMLFSNVELGDRVREGQRLGKVIDPIRNREFEITAPFAGRVIGMALNQVVLPGFAAYHLGVETTEAEAAAEAERPALDADPLETMDGDEMAPSGAEIIVPRDEGDPDAPE
jgi:predicted deacylase